MSGFVYCILQYPTFSDIFRHLARNLQKITYFFLLFPTFSYCTEYFNRSIIDLLNLQPTNQDLEYKVKFYDKHLSLGAYQFRN
jgi:hypothetical protein